MAHSTVAGLATHQLPDRDSVNSDNIEDAYVDFIFYCNPALPRDCDTDALRDAFRNPPRSGGKVFSPYLIYELVRKFYEKDIKTWTELTIKLGVEPPDPTKDESAQKIAQYGVRLKKWLHSMHVKAFFEYLMDIANEYWTSVPQDESPTAVAVRDGVAVEDDMALRALLPHIRPKRGRRRPDGGDDAINSPAPQRQRLSSPPASAADDPRQNIQPSPWQVSSADFRVSGAVEQLRTPATAWPVTDVLQTPLERWPSSAITPSSKSTFWNDAMEPKSALTPSRSNQRRGVKNVSSAWKLGGNETGGKTRGRPPINRTPIDTPSALLTPWSAASGQTETPKESPNSARDPSAPTFRTTTKLEYVPGESLPVITTVLVPQLQQVSQEGTRPGRPRPSISLQVPQRTGGQVRLATPPPPPPSSAPPTHPSTAPPTLNQPSMPPPIVYQHEGDVQGKWPSSEGQASGWSNLASGVAGSQHNAGQIYQRAAPATGETGGSGSGSNSANTNNGTFPSHEVPHYYFETMEERANIDELMAYFTRVTHESEWFDGQGAPTEAASVEESTAIINSTLENMYKTAASPQAFLINLAALAGARMLMTGLSKCTRLGEQNDFTAYRCDWEYQFGNLRGYFSMSARVPFSMWRQPRPASQKDGGDDSAVDPAHDVDDDDDISKTTTQMSAEHWQSKYHSLLGEMEKKDMELFRLRNSLLTSLREHHPRPN